MAHFSVPFIFLSSSLFSVKLSVIWFCYQYRKFFHYLHNSSFSKPVIFLFVFSVMVSRIHSLKMFQNLLQCLNKCHLFLLEQWICLYPYSFAFSPYFGDVKTHTILSCLILILIDLSEFLFLFVVTSLMPLCFLTFLRFYQKLNYSSASKNIFQSHL